MDIIELLEQVLALVFCASFAVGVISFIIDIWLENSFFEKLTKSCIALFVTSLLAAVLFGSVS